MLNQFIKFRPILKEKIWGGSKLRTHLNKNSESDNLGESWEISDVKGDTSVVSNGDLKGKDLKELIKTYQADLVGDKVFKQFGNKFPLLIKFIDAKTPLSIQLHPNDKLAKERHDSFGKTEMWYVMQADEKANLIVGFQQNSNKEEYLKHLNNKSLLDILNVDEVKKGDVYFIPTGRIHAIGAGVLLAEIQQTSDITYRIYDWDRQDSEGNYRELHTELALDAIDFTAIPDYTTSYDESLNSSSEIVSCPYFTTNVLPIEGELFINHQDKDSFVIYMCVSGKVSFVHKNQEEILIAGETVLVPAKLKEFKLKSVEKSELLEVYIR
ncbi:type I phosphomannose isomerase catalytic subunit [Tenacibaculum jejuense]|uniref:Phosphohexomutase n=1 Tax=Tenacibaculum jejuense TaxID=584609 RepID=A0A238U8F4_9FLAO|nr:type I phosphomannose isomerase catalytic subunit [Tenacibaculum jejuense]SNR15266.1 Mannose-6-phosphate isomerase [Tenacibaculum jejuense]